MLSPQQLSQLRDRLAVASQTIMTFYRQDVKIERKNDNTPVTEADIAVSRYLEIALTEVLDIPVLSEESPKTAAFLNWQRYWLIDPIDGTRGFINQDDEFCICIAIIDNHKAVFGAICAPVTGQIWYANKGSGVYQATTYQPKEPPVKLKKPVSATKSTTFTVVTKSLHYSNALTTFIDATLPEFTRITCGSALKFMCLIEGKAQLHFKFGKTSEWDTAAAQVILEEQGGGIINLAGAPLRYGTKRSVTNPRFIAYHQIPATLLEQFIRTAKEQELS